MNYFRIIKDNLKLSIDAFIQAHKLIWRKGFWKFFIITAFFSTVFFISTFSLVLIYAQIIVEWIFSFIPTSPETELMYFLQNIIYFLLSISIRLFILMVYFSLFRNFIMIILAPLMAYIAEKTANYLGFNTGTFNYIVFIKNVWRSVLINTRNILKELILTLMLFLFSFIPVFNLFTPFILIMVQSYFHGYSMMDYSMELNSLNIKQSINFMRNNKILAVSIGGIFYIIFLIPYIGSILAPVYGTVAATIVTYPKIKNH